MARRSVRERLVLGRAGKGSWPISYRGGDGGGTRKLHGVVSNLFARAPASQEDQVRSLIGAMQSEAPIAPRTMRYLPP